MKHLSIYNNVAYIGKVVPSEISNTCKKCYIIYLEYSGA